MKIDSSLWQIHRDDPTFVEGIHVRISMVQGLDGTIAFGGKSNSVGKTLDKLAFRAVRSNADCILNASSTVINEDVRSATLFHDNIKKHVVITSSNALHKGLRIFGEGVEDVIIIASSLVSPVVIKEWETLGAEVVRVGTEKVEMSWLIPYLRDSYGVRRLVSEGGPALNKQLLEANLVDEICLTIRAALFAKNESYRPSFTHALSTQKNLHIKNIQYGEEEILCIFSAHSERKFDK